MLKLLDNGQFQVIGQVVVEASQHQWVELQEVRLHRQVLDRVMGVQAQESRVSGMVGLIPGSGYD